ncbi:MAG: hypothetical protein F6K55_30260 [Moorea sp. SIO4A3]|nr:hypothetical protein [Moorena sp. SIO4A3]
MHPEAIGKRQELIKYIGILGNSYLFSVPDSRFPIPDSRFPIPDSRFPIPDSRFPVPDSRFPIPDSRFPFLINPMFTFQIILCLNLLQKNG